MTDTEKNIKGIQECDLNGGLIGNCPYKGILALLKEREAVEPILIREAWNKYYNYYVCPRCKNEVVYDQKYCSECGISFLWEGQ